MESLQTLVRLWQARSAGELLLCPLGGAASPVTSSVGDGGSLAVHSGGCCTQWALDCSLLINCVPRNAQVTNDASERLNL